MNLKQTLAACWFASTLSLPVQAQTGFADDFEAPALDPWWTPTATSGSITFPARTRVRSGSQSVRFDSTQTSANKLVMLVHVFAQPVTGRFSVWLFDEGAGVASHNGVGLSLNDAAIVVGAPDYNTAPTGGALRVPVGRAGLARVRGTCSRSRAPRASSRSPSTACPPTPGLAVSPSTRWHCSCRRQPGVLRPTPTSTTSGFPRRLRPIRASARAALARTARRRSCSRAPVRSSARRSR